MDHGVQFRRQDASGDSLAFDRRPVKDIRISTGLESGFEFVLFTLQVLPKATPFLSADKADSLAAIRPIVTALWAES
jgi:hypothetical protein